MDTNLYEKNYIIILISVYDKAKMKKLSYMPQYLCQEDNFRK